MSLVPCSSDVSCTSSSGPIGHAVCSYPEGQRIRLLFICAHTSQSASQPARITTAWQTESSDLLPATRLRANSSICYARQTLPFILSKSVVPQEVGTDAVCPVHGSYSPNPQTLTTDARPWPAARPAAGAT